LAFAIKYSSAEGGGKNGVLTVIACFFLLGRYRTKGFFESVYQSTDKMEIRLFVF
jgi:hypothetical protein